MSGDFLTQWAWVLWLALILVFIIIEVVTLEFTFLMLALGSLAGLISGLIGVPWWGQAIVAAVAALLLLFLIRPALLRSLRKGGDPTRSNIEALHGLAGTVVIGDENGPAQVKLANGETWTSRLSAGADGRSLTTGDRVIVIGIDGSTAVVDHAS
ncbi:MAG TPA: NfeD family protein [Pseudolysinimonas sp.]|nr:NfeD family protein [Pseudolysinimonas sp.]